MTAELFAGMAVPFDAAPLRHGLSLDRKIRGEARGCSDCEKVKSYSGLRRLGFGGVGSSFGILALLAAGRLRGGSPDGVP